MELFAFIGTWFGYVGACLVAPDATCRPFLAFILLCTAASAALILVILAYRSAQAREATLTEERRARLRSAETRERVRRAVAARAATPKAQFDQRYRPAI